MDGDVRASTGSGLLEVSIGLILLPASTATTRWSSLDRSCGFITSETAPTEGRFGTLEAKGKLGMAGMIGNARSCGRVEVLVVVLLCG